MGYITYISYMNDINIITLTDVNHNSSSLMNNLKVFTPKHFGKEISKATIYTKKKRLPSKCIKYINLIKNDKIYYTIKIINWESRDFFTIYTNEDPANFSINMTF